MMINKMECEKAGIDIKKVRKLANGLSLYARMAEEMKITIFGGSSSGTLRYDDGKRRTDGALIIAHLDGNFWDGGDGGDHTDDDGFLRGE